MTGSTRFLSLRRFAFAPILLIGAALAAALAWPTQFFASDQGDTVPVAALISNPRAFDGKMVTVEGEAIGEVLLRKDRAWINISNQGMALGVYCSTEQASIITRLGNWKTTGDWVRVTGVFKVASASQDGESYLEAQSIAVVVKGTPRRHPVSPGRVTAAIVLGVLTLLVANAAAKKHGWPLRPL